MRLFTLGVYSVLFSVFAAFNAGCAPYHHHLVGVGVEIETKHDNGHHYGRHKHHKHDDDDDR
jgi:hypothetical protein